MLLLKMYCTIATWQRVTVYQHHIRAISEMVVTHPGQNGLERGPGTAVTCVSRLTSDQVWTDTRFHHQPDTKWTPDGRHSDGDDRHHQQQQQSWWCYCNSDQYWLMWCTSEREWEIELHIATPSYLDQAPAEWLEKSGLVLSSLHQPPQPLPTISPTVSS